MGKTKTPARVTVEAHWSASKKVSLDLASPASSAGGSDVQLKEFLACTPMSENTTTGSKPPWEESSQWAISERTLESKLNKQSFIFLLNFDSLLFSLVV